MKLPTNDERLLQLLAAWGVAYSWGAGGPRTSDFDLGTPGLKSGVGYDCSGFCEAALVQLGLMLPTEPRRSAAQLFDAATVVAAGSEQMGDLAFYGAGQRVQHVMLVVGTGIVFGARGGGPLTNADDPRAFVQLEPLRYWSLFMGVRRLPALAGGS